ncbi:MAG: NPCBM/NEW2 domain-containing protein [Sedimentisphaerales bacterium]|nr:NPCBM/NEW2 domain-containing protein [Sedimentisphaerales bacterium]
MTERSEHLISLFLLDPSAMTEEQARELSSWISQDTRNTKEFIRASLFRRCIHDILLSSDEGRICILHDSMTTSDANAESFFDKQFWHLLLQEEATAPKIEIESPAIPEHELFQKIEPMQQVRREKKVRRINKKSLFKAILSTAALIFFVFYFASLYNTKNVEVATLTDSLNAQWAESSAPTINSRLMTNHTPLMLRKGYAEIVFDNNSKVVVEAPAEFQVLSYDEIKLTYGRLYVTVPQEAMGFIVSTPNSKIIDLGTEFGVQTDINGSTELHVAKGKTALVSGAGDTKNNILVYAGAAKKVAYDSLESIDIACNNRMFARYIDSKSRFVWRGQNISLADIVGGGNGFGSGVLNQGIEVSTGRATFTLATTDMHAGRGGYVRVPSNPYIDGIFVPGLGSDMTQINSVGLQTGAFPNTSGMIWGYIINGAWHHGFDVERHNLQLDGVTYDGKRNPAITMHSNLAITFDLHALREKLPGVSIKSFSSTFGVSNTVEKWLKNRDFSDMDQSPEVVRLAREHEATAEFWVFLDGEKVLQQKVSSASKAGIVDVPVDESVRFLTLAVTEADDTSMFDWALFGQPELILESSN